MSSSLTCSSSLSKSFSSAAVLTPRRRGRRRCNNSVGGGFFAAKTSSSTASSASTNDDETTTTGKQQQEGRNNKSNETQKTGRPKSPFYSQGKHQRRRDDKIIQLRRGEFKNREDPPPWETTWSVDSRLMKIEGSLFEEEEEEDKEEEGASCLIDIKGYAEPSGPHSFFLKAEITGHIRCHCDACDGKFNLPVKSGFKLFLDEHATAFGDVSGDLEIVPFPRSTEHVDLTSVARSWIEMNLKEEFLCDECGENDGVVETWSLDYDGEVKIKK